MEFFAILLILSGKGEEITSHCFRLCDTPSEPLSLSVQGRPPVPSVALTESGCRPGHRALSTHTALPGGKAVWGSAGCRWFRTEPWRAPRPRGRPGMVRGLPSAVLAPPPQAQVSAPGRVHDRQAGRRHAASVVRL